jgi:hypothetical protein
MYFIMREKQREKERERIGFALNTACYVSQSQWTWVCLSSKAHCVQ